MSDTKSSNGNGTATATTTLTTEPFPASQKVYVAGAHTGVRVPMREISLTATKSMDGGKATSNEPITVYDTSGPYTDPSVNIDTPRGWKRLPKSLNNIAYYLKLQKSRFMAMANSFQYKITIQDGKCTRAVI